MQDIITRFFEDLAGRVGGPLTLRLLLQPAMAIFFALRDAKRDAREGRVPYFWALFSSPEHRRELVREGWKSVGKVFVIAIVLDVVYQIIAIRWVYPVEALVVACVLAILPYLLVRGPVNRLFSGKQRRDDQDGQP